MDSCWNRHFLAGGPRFAVWLRGLMVGLAWVATAATGPGAGTNGVPASPVATSLHDIRGPFEIRSFGDVLRLASLVLLIVGLMALAWWFWRRRKPKAEQVRLVQWEGERLVLSPPPMQRGGASIARELVWERVG